MVAINPNIFKDKPSATEETRSSASPLLDAIDKAQAEGLRIPDLDPYKKHRVRHTFRFQVVNDIIKPTEHADARNVYRIYDHQEKKNIEEWTRAWDAHGRCDLLNLHHEIEQHDAYMKEEFYSRHDNQD